MCDHLITQFMMKRITLMPKNGKKNILMLFNPVPGLLLSKHAERGLVCSAKGVSYFSISNTKSDMKDLFIISYHTEFL